MIAFRWLVRNAFYRVVPVFVSALLAFTALIHLDTWMHGPEGWAAAVVGEELKPQMVAGRPYDLAVAVFVPLLAIWGIHSAYNPSRYTVTTFWMCILVAAGLNARDIVGQVLRGARRTEDVVATGLTVVFAAVMLIRPCPYSSSIEPQRAV